MHFNTEWTTLQHAHAFQVSRLSSARFPKLAHSIVSNISPIMPCIMQSIQFTLCSRHHSKPRHTHEASVHPTASKYDIECLFILLDCRADQQGSSHGSLSTLWKNVVFCARPAGADLRLHSMLQAQLSVSLGLLCCQQALRRHFQLFSQGIVVLLQAVSPGQPCLSLVGRNLPGCSAFTGCACLQALGSLPPANTSSHERTEMLRYVM